MKPKKHYTDKKVILRPTLICNWNCKYCGCINGDLEKLDYEKMMETIKYLFKHYPSAEYILSGGEPGLLPLEYIENILSLKAQYGVLNIDLETNGEMFKRDIDLSVFRQIRYHFVDDIKNFELKNLYINNDLNIEYLFVIDREDIFLDIDNFFIQTSEIFKDKRVRLKTHSPLLHNKRFMLKLMIYVKKKQLSGFRFFYYSSNKEFLKPDLSKLRQECKEHPSYFDFVFPRDTIYPCCILSYDHMRYLEINDTNINNIFNNNIIVNHSYCDQCIKLINIDTDDNFFREKRDI